MELLYIYRSHLYFLRKALHGWEDIDTSLKSAYDGVLNAMEVIVKESNELIVSTGDKIRALIDSLMLFLDTLGFVDVLSMLAVLMDVNITLRAGYSVPVKLSLDIEDAIMNDSQGQPVPEVDSALWKDRFITLLRYLLSFLMCHGRLIRTWMGALLPNSIFFEEDTPRLLLQVNAACLARDRDPIAGALLILQNKIAEQELPTLRKLEADTFLGRIGVDLDAGRFDCIYSAVYELCLLVPISKCEHMFHERFNDSAPARFEMLLEEGQPHRRSVYDECMGKVVIGKTKSQELLTLLEPIASKDLCDSTIALMNLFDRIYQAVTIRDLLLDRRSVEVALPSVICGILKLMDMFEEAEALYCVLLGNDTLPYCVNHSGLVAVLLFEAGFVEPNVSGNAIPYLICAIQARCVARIGGPHVLLDAFQIANELNLHLHAVWNILLIADGELGRTLLRQYKAVLSGFPWLSSQAIALQRLVDNQLSRDIIQLQMESVLEELGRISDPRFDGVPRILAELNTAVLALAEDISVARNTFERRSSLRRFVERVRPSENKLLEYFAQVPVQAEPVDTVHDFSRTGAPITESPGVSSADAGDGETSGACWCGC